MRYLILLIFLVLIGCNNSEDVDISYIHSQYELATTSINTVQYRALQTDTIEAIQHTFKRSGTVLLEKSSEDDLFGFKLYVTLDSLPNEYLYDQGVAFEIFSENKSYEINCSPDKFMGSPGGQLVNPYFFNLESSYETVTIKENQHSYFVKYNFSVNSTDDYYYTELELDKTNYLPKKVITVSLVNQKRFSHEIQLSEILINPDDVEPIAFYKSRLNEFKPIETIVREPTNINRVISQLDVKKLDSKDTIIQFSNHILTLIDFWEVWCAPCLESLPDLEVLSSKYSNDLEIVGIVTQDPTVVVSTLEQKGISFSSYLGTGDLRSSFNITSFPTYLLLDQSGRVLKEYFGFNKQQIESDIKNYL